MIGVSKRVITIYFILITCCAIRAFAGSTPRSLWVWEGSTRRVLNNTAEKNKLLDLATAKNIKTLYLYADYFDGLGYAGNDVVDNPTLYQSFISEAHSKGIEVQALLGSRALRTWEYILPSKRTDALSMITNVLNYNSISSANETFDGFNVDIEPYILADWWSQQPVYSQYYMDMLSEQKQLITDSGQQMEFGPVIPRWYEDQASLNISWNGITLNLLYHILNLSDYITVMDYRNTALNIILDASDEIEYADSIGKKVVVGIETAYTDESPFISFYGDTEQQMEQELAGPESIFETHSSYDGIAFNHYESYFDMVVPEPSTIVLLLMSNLCFFLTRFWCRSYKK